MFRVYRVYRVSGFLASAQVLRRDWHDPYLPGDIVHEPPRQLTSTVGRFAVAAECNCNSGLNSKCRCAQSWHSATGDPRKQPASAQKGFSGPGVCAYCSVGGVGGKGYNHE